MLINIQRKGFEPTFWLLELALVVWSAPSLAATLFVSNLNDSGPGSLRDTIAAANSGDTINFSARGTITITSAPLTISKNLTIGGPGGDALAITCGGSSGRALEISSGNVTISGLTVRNCAGPDGCALYVDAGASATVSSCILLSNIVTGSYIGACVSSAGTLTLLNSTVTKNNAFESIAVDGKGGSTLVVDNCLFEFNETALRSHGNVAVNNSTFFENSYGAIFLDGTATITSCTIYQNHNDYLAAGVEVYLPGSLTIRNTILAKNLTGGQERNLGHIPGTITSQGYNLASDDGSGQLTGPNDQLYADPQLDPAGPLDNGGPTATIALTALSPAIDKGKSFGLTTDQRGLPRPVDNPSVFPAPAGDGSDIGAYEAPTDPLRGGNEIIVTTLDDHDDGVCGVDDCTLREAVSRSNEAAVYGLHITFAPGLTGTIILNRLLGELPIHRANIIGPGARVLAVSGGEYIRIFDIGFDSDATISGLTLREGWTFGGNPGTTNQGGAIRNLGYYALISDCAFVHNYAAGPNAAAGSGGAGGAGLGGAIYNGGTMRLSGCTFSGDATSGGNLAAGGYGGSISTQLGFGGTGGAGQGGAVYNAGFLNVSNCTFSANASAGGAGGNGYFGGNGGAGQGGAIFNQGTIVLVGCTIAGNTGSGGGGGTGGIAINNGVSGAGNGGIAAIGTNTTIGDTISALNSASGFLGRSFDVDGAFNTLGFNLIGSTNHSTGFTSSTDQAGTDDARLDPLLGSLQNNGGQTDTLSPLAGSPALDKGSRLKMTADQRGIARPIDDSLIANATDGDGSDIGAVEFFHDGPQTGSNLVVTTLDDHDDGVASFLDCTLREAINAANAASGSSTITFGPTVNGTIVLGSALPGANADVTILGPGARLLTVDGNRTSRVFSFLSGHSSVSGLTISDGYVGSSLPGSAAQGAGVFNQGTLTLTACRIIQNRVQGTAEVLVGNGGSGKGGGVYNSGQLLLDRCSLHDNSASGGNGAGAAIRTGPGNGGWGVGGVFNDLGGTLALQNCTFYLNSGVGGSGGDGTTFGGNGGPGYGAVFNQGALTVTSCTFSDNSGGGGSGGSGSTSGVTGAASGGLGQATGTGTNMVRNTIISGNGSSGSSGGPDLNGVFDSEGYNLIGNGEDGTGFTNAGDQVGTFPAKYPGLAAPDFNESDTETMALSLASFALNQGKSFDLTLDQRGFPRTVSSPTSLNPPGGDGTDIGAFEYNPSLEGLTDYFNPPTDTDGDRMPDDFEIFYGFNLQNPLDASQDPDGDGVTSLQEFQAGTNPRDPTNRLEIISVQRDGGNAVIRFTPALPLHSYELEYKNSLTDPVWSTLPSVPGLNPSVAGIGQFTDSTAGSATARFYRIGLTWWYF